MIWNESVNRIADDSDDVDLPIHEVNTAPAHFPSESKFLLHGFIPWTIEEKRSHDIRYTIDPYRMISSREYTKPIESQVCMNQLIDPVLMTRPLSEISDVVRRFM